MHIQCFIEVSEALQEGAQKESVFCTILTGNGRSYSSGVDLLDLSDINTEDRLIATG